MLETILGITIFVIILVLLSFIIDEKKHGIFKILLVLFMVIGSVLLAKATLDAGTICENKLNTTTETYYYGENYTNNWQGSGTPPGSATTPVIMNKTLTEHYSKICYDLTTTNTGLFFYRFVMSFVAIFFIYVLVYFSYIVLQFAGESFKRR